MSSDVIATLAATAYFVVSQLATLYVHKRGFTGKRFVLLIMLVWLVPILGAGCAFAAAWEWGRSVGSAESIPDVWLAARSSDSQSGSGADTGDGNE